MKTTDELIIAACYRLSDLGDVYDTQLTPIHEAVAVRSLLADGLLKVEAAKALNLSSTKAVTYNKEFLQKVMVLCIFKFVERSAVMANITPNCEELFKSLDIKITTITDIKDSQIGTRCMELFNIMKKNAAILTNIKPADFTQMTQVMDDYNAILAAPKTAIEKRKASGTDIIHSLVIEAQGHMKNLVKIFHSYLPDNAHLADVAARIGRPSSVRYTSIALHILDSVGHMPLRKVKCTLTNGTDTIIRYSSRKGFIRFYSLPNALWTITLDYPDYQSYYQKEIATVEKQIVRININLVKNAAPDDPSVDPDVTMGSLTTLVYYKSSQAPAAGAQNSIQSANYVGTTDEDGEDYCGELKIGTIQGVVYLEGYIPVPYSVEIKAGENVVIKIYLEPASAPDNNTPDS